MAISILAAAILTTGCSGQAAAPSAASIAPSRPSAERRFTMLRSTVGMPGRPSEPASTTACGVSEWGATRVQ
jgi:hypothetical protein